VRKHKHLRVVHRLAHRLRVAATPLAKQPERCYILEILLRKHPAITGVRTVPGIGSVVVHYDPARLPEERLLATLDAVIGNIVSAPPPKPLVAAPLPPDAPLQECNIAVEGMTCASCALLIEMSLQRDPRVQNVAVNFAAGTATVKGHLTREELFASVAKLGYEPRPMDTLAQRRLVVEREKERLQVAKKKLWQSVALTLPVMASGMLMHQSPALRLIEFALSTATVFGPGGDIFRKAWMLAKQREANMDTLISIGAGAADRKSVV
jgi:Cu+-exporting ATPase